MSTTGPKLSRLRLDSQLRAPVAERKPYARPTLEVYGSLRDLTAEVGAMGADDGGFGVGSMTGV